MKRAVLLASLAALAMLVLQPAMAAAGDKLLAPVYPGAVAVDIPLNSGQTEQYYTGEASSPFVRVFLSKDPIEKVRAFYEQKFGRMENRYFTGWDWEGEWPFAYMKTLAKADPRFDLSMGMASEVPAGVEIRAEDPSKVLVESETYWPGVGRFFERLQLLTATNGLSKAEYDGLVKKYGYLGARYYAVGKRTDEDGKRLMVDEAIFKAAEDKIGAPLNQMSAEEYQARAQQLMAEKRYDEYAKLNEQFTASMMAAQQNATGPTGAKVYKEGLAELERNAYRTLIVIHLHPSQWDAILKQIQ